MSSFPKATRESLPVSESSQHLALRTNVLEGRFCELRLHLILGSRTFTLRSSWNFTCAVLRRPKTLAATPDDVGSGFLGGDPTLCRPHRRSVPQRVVPRTPAHLCLDRLQPANSGGRHTMVAVSKEDPFWGRKDDDGQ